MAEAGIRPARAREMLAPARQLTQRSGFWRTQGDGLVLYITEGLFRYFRLPVSVPERVVMAERFDLKPLLPLFTSGGRFYLLALSQKAVRLFEGTRFGIAEIDLQNVPQGVREALKYDVREHQQQAHTGTGARGVQNKEGAVFHGQAEGVDDAKRKTLEYFRQVNRGIKGMLKDPWAPLVSAGTEVMLPLYRQANTYAGLIEDGIKGNPDGMRPDELHKAALETLEPVFNRARQAALDQYRSFTGTGRASGVLPEIVRAAAQGRVELALIPTSAEQWGRYDAERDAVEVHETAQHGDEDLVNEVAVQTVINHGAVYAVAPEEIPGASPVAAVFRYVQAPAS